MSIEVEDYIWSLEETQKEIASFLHDILITYSNIEPKIRFKIPFYYQKTWIAYLNPIKEKGIELAFVRARELSDYSGILDFKDRKLVAGISYYKVSEISEEMVRAIFEEAIFLDETVPFVSSKNRK